MVQQGDAHGCNLIPTMGIAEIICTVEKGSVGDDWEGNMNESLDTSPWINRNHTLEMKQSHDRQGNMKKDIKTGSKRPHPSKGHR